MFRFFVTPLMLALAAGAAHAVVVPKDVQAVLNQRYETFVSADGFSRVDSSKLQQDWDTPERFPDRDSHSIFASDTAINGATKALMLLQSQEPSLPHVRYRVTYRLDNAPDFGGYANAYVEVTRFNLGPARRDDVVASTPAGVPVAPAEYFGVGPNVSWRFVMGSIQGQLADVVSASRRELLSADAKAMDCLGAPCLSLESSSGPTGEWKPIKPPTVKSPPYVAQINGVATAARISELLYSQASGGQPQIEALARHAEEPQLTFVISMNVEGQDDNANGLLHQQFLMDDAISEIWTRRLDAGPDTVEWLQHFVYHKGRH